MANIWNSPKSSSEVYRRAGGRRRYNRQRQVNAIVRRMEVLELLKEGGRTLEQIGVITGVSTSTAGRDVRRLMSLGVAICPTCNAVVHGEQARLLHAET